MNIHEKINYLEFPSLNIEKTKAFFSDVFGWEFVDYGPDYTSFTNAGIEGGFFKSSLLAQVENGSVLVVIYSKNIEQTKVKIEKSGGLISRAIFSFPGGRRFHFNDPNGNEYAVWSDLT